ncbi:aminotransferase class I/II-fold pyridoxal phosphate-dependent enzyme [Heyndrickxia oleronia]|uniref:DegT/DnrJ/EryC1/StrS family aminotransferase n=1 Tax=Heyndrickxia oleronia TaxID=38875 RepID=UPI00203DB17D|nr:aminotransferase class I/II-fold pyridoxal phosphate-dependent enzyme [Heyndrickxia oleronia]MCM3236314.1 aminotransferase class I/II-fold pyridoxal phosphate-dependent enzyme [Heyndrickxia oleronia]
MVNTIVKNRIYLSTPHMSGSEINYIKNAFEQNWIAPQGPNVEAFEREIASLLGVADAVAVSSGTAAIHLALSLLDIKKGDRVFCSTLTFIASANPILYQGAEPVFIDSESETWNMSPLALEEAFQDACSEGKLPKAVIIVNLYGQSAKMEELLPICQKYNVPVIEDAAESLGSFYQNKASGTFGDYGIYSFNGNKIITTSGGGILISKQANTLNKARFLSTQAKDPAPHYQHSQLGYNYRLSNILAGIGRGQLEVLTQRVNERRRIFEIYERELGGIPGLSFMRESKRSFSNRWLTTMTINQTSTGISNKDLLIYLEKENIEARMIWKPLHLQPLFTTCKYFSQNNENISEKIFKTGICLPSSSNMTLEDQMRVIQCIKNLLGR